MYRQKAQRDPQMKVNTYAHTQTQRYLNAAKHIEKGAEVFPPSESWDKTA